MRQKSDRIKECGHAHKGSKGWVNVNMQELEEKVGKRFLQDV